MFEIQIGMEGRIPQNPSQPFGEKHSDLKFCVLGFLIIRSRLKPDQGTALCFKQDTSLSVPLFSQVYKLIPVN